MTRFEPFLKLNRLVVLKDGRKVYDQSFHGGVNIIRGENGSGKSTVADFIFHALGGEVPSWRSQAVRCDFTLAEVEIAGQPLTLRREVSEERRRPLDVYWAGYEVSREHAVEGWERFPFAAAGEKESFSQLLFKLLGLPDALRADLQARVTMHQLLRLLYVDQRTPYDRIFLGDDWNPALTRSAIGDLVLGVYDDLLYEVRLDIRKLEEELSEIKTELRGIGEVLKDGDQVLTTSALEEAIHRAGSEQTALEEDLRATEDEEAEASPPDIRESTEALKRAQTTVRTFTENLEIIQFEIQDSADLIAALELRLEALDDASSAREAVDSVVFEFCPCCYARLEQDMEGDQCSLCRTAYNDDAIPNVLRLRHEISTQLRESRDLQADRLAEANLLEMRLRGAVERQHQAQRRLDALTAGAVSSTEAARAEIHRRLGYLERQVEDLGEKRRMAGRLAELEETRDGIIVALEALRATEESRDKTLAERRDHAKQEISGLAVEILRRDLPREPSFQRAEYVSFDFSRDMVSVDGRSNFAASSMVLLKNAFHLALMLASTRLEYMRYPRFALFDNVEDKGMEPERSHNFQRLLVEYSEEALAEHQIIMTTSGIAPEFDDSKYVVGPSYTHERRTLEISS